MSQKERLINVQDRILLHLMDRQGSKHQYNVPSTLTPTGIAEALGTNKTYVFTSIKKSVDNGYVRECYGWVKNQKKKQKYFLLTHEGKKYTQLLKRELSNLPITLVLGNGTKKTMELNNIIPYLDKEKTYSDITELNLYNIISKDNILKIEQLKNMKKVKYIDYSSEAPRVVHFFGRKKEIATLKKWIKNKKGYNVVFIHGMAGIGKTTLAAKLIESYRDSKHLFWHNFHELDTLRGVLFKMAEFLSKMGDDHLELFIRTRTNLDYHEVSRILKKSIGTIDAVLIFDDFHKSNDQIRSFFVYILRMLTSSSKTKILILSREIVPFYDRRDVLTRKIVAELLIEGLDFESSKRLLSGKGIDKTRFKDIYGYTAGNPLFLEIFETNGHLERYIHDELFSKLQNDERKIFEIISIYRFPTTEDCLAANDDFDFEKLYTLYEKSLVKKDAHNRYFIHDIIKQFFYRRLSSSNLKKHHLIAAQWYETSDEPVDLIEAIYHYYETGDYKRATQIAIDRSTSILEGGYAPEFLAALERFDERKVETRIWAKILIVKGKACSMVGECKKAILYFTQSADISTVIGDEKLKVKAICESGHILEEQNELGRAMECFKEGLDISKKADYSKNIGECLRGIGRVHWRNSQHKEAILSYEKCLEISEKVNDLELLASTYIDLGNVYDEMYEIEKAIECYTKGLDILKKIENTYETARAYANLAITYRHMEDFESAIVYHEKQLELAENLRDMKTIGYCYASLSYCLAKIQEFEKARGYAEKAEDIASKIDNENIMYQVNKTYAQLCKHEENWERAVNYLMKSIEVDEKLKSLHTLSDSHNELGLLYEDMGDLNNAKKHFEIAANLKSKLGLGKTKPI